MLSGRKERPTKQRSEPRNAVLYIAALHAELKEFKAKNPREFWKKIHQATNRETQEDIPIPVEELGYYFKSLLGSSTATQHADPSPGFETDALLDDPIDEEEVRAAIKALKTTKPQVWTGYQRTQCI